MLNTKLSCSQLVLVAQVFDMLTSAYTVKMHTLLKMGCSVSQYTFRSATTLTASINDILCGVHLLDQHFSYSLLSVVFLRPSVLKTIF